MKLEVELDDEKVDRLCSLLENMGLIVCRDKFIEHLKELFTASASGSLDVFCQALILIKSGAVNPDEINEKMDEISAMLGINL